MCMSMCIHVHGHASHCYIRDGSFTCNLFLSCMLFICFLLFFFSITNMHSSTGQTEDILPGEWVAFVIWYYCVLWVWLQTWLPWQKYMCAYTVAVNKKLTLRFHFYDRGTVLGRAVKQ